MRWKPLLLVVLIAYGGWHYLQTRPVPMSPGIAVAEEPSQIPLRSLPALQLKNYQVDPLAGFSLKARVLSTEHYRFGRESEISPIDLALGWGRMSDPTVLSRIDISQSGRFYFWRVQEFPIPREEIEHHSANMHMIPANSAVMHRLDSVRPSQLITLRGYLVEVRASDGWHWRSSLTRDDTGNGACELVWVESIEISAAS